MCGTKVVIPMEIRVPIRRSVITEDNNSSDKVVNLVVAKEKKI